MAGSIPVFRSAFHSPEDEFSGEGIRPVVFDILGPDYETSLLPDHLKMVLHVNPISMKMSHSKVIARSHTEGGFVEQHFGDGTETIQFEMVTGGFMRLYTGLTAITGGGVDIGGTRRDTIAYDKYLDMLALFKNGGHVYDAHGRIAFNGIIKVWFDGHTWYGWLSNFSVVEEADSPYQFRCTTTFTIDHESVLLRSTILPTPISSSEDLSTTTFKFQEESLHKEALNPEPYELFENPDVEAEKVLENAAPTDPEGDLEKEKERLQEEETLSSLPLPEGNVTENFSWREFYSNECTPVYDSKKKKNVCGKKTIRATPVPVEFQENVKELCVELEKIRAVVGKMHIVSGWRSSSYNTLNGGAEHSQHLIGRAADFSVSGITPRELKKIIISLIDSHVIKNGGVGLYDTFVHYDIRGRREYFYGENVQKDPGEGK